MGFSLKKTLKSGLRRLPVPVVKLLRKVFRREGQAKLGSKSGRTARSAVAQQHLNLGRAYLSHWDILPAYTEINRSIGANFMNGEAHRLHSYILEIMGEMAASRGAARAAFHSDPLNVQSFQLLAKHGLKKDIARGLDDIVTQVARRNWTATAVLHGCQCYLELGEPELAEDLIVTAADHATALGPRDRTLMMGRIRLAQRDMQGAVDQLETLLEDPRLGLTATHLLGECLMELGQFAEAEEVIERAIRGSDRGRARGFNTPLYLMRFKTGHTRAAFREARHRPFTAALRDDVDSRYIQYLAELEHLDRVCMVSDFGIGDEIRFANIYPDLLVRKANMTITCDPRLLTLLERSFPGAEFLPVRRWRAEALIADPDSRAGMPSRRLTPHLDRRALDHIEAGDGFTSVFDMLAELRPDHASFARDVAAYLVPDPMRVAAWRERIRTGSVTGLPNVALSWRSLLRSGARNLHYLDPNDLGPLNDVDAVYWLFQSGLEPEEVAALRGRLTHVRVIEDLDIVDDFEGQAAFLTGMDAVVAPCTTTAELAGALGVRTLMFGRTFGATWRSHPEGHDVWHPTLTLVTGHPIADRAATVKALVDALQDVTASTH